MNLIVYQYSIYLAIYRFIIGFVTWPPFCLSLIISTKGGQVTKPIIIVKITCIWSNKRSIDKQWSNSSTILIAFYHYILNSLAFSLRMAALNSRHRPKNIWLLKKCTYVDKQWYKNQNTKNLPQCYNYSSNNTISSFKQAKCCNICPLEIFKKSNEIKFSSASQPACYQELT